MSEFPARYRDQRVMVLIDGDNCDGMAYEIAKREGTNYRIDLKKLCDVLVGPRQPYDLTCFLSLPADALSTHTEEEQTQIFDARSKKMSYVRALRLNEIRVVTFVRERQYDRKADREYVSGYPDTKLWKHALKRLPFFDTLVLVSGDGDFYDLLEILSEDFNKRVEICGIVESMSESLQNIAQHFWDLRLLSEKVRYISKFEAETAEVHA